MERIGVEVQRSCADITPLERGQTSYPGVSSYHALWVRESLTNHLDKGKQMTAGFGLAGAPLNESLVAADVYREGEARYVLAEPRLAPQGV